MVSTRSSGQGVHNEGETLTLRSRTISTATPSPSRRQKVVAEETASATKRRKTMVGENDDDGGTKEGQEMTDGMDAVAIAEEGQTTTDEDISTPGVGEGQDGMASFGKTENTIVVTDLQPTEAEERDPATIELNTEQQVEDALKSTHGPTEPADILESQGEMLVAETASEGNTDQDVLRQEADLSVVNGKSAIRINTPSKKHKKSSSVPTGEGKNKRTLGLDTPKLPQASHKRFGSEDSVLEHPQIANTLPDDELLQAESKQNAGMDLGEEEEEDDAAAPEMLDSHVKALSMKPVAAIPKKTKRKPKSHLKKERTPEVETQNPLNREASLPNFLPQEILDAAAKRPIGDLQIDGDPSESNSARQAVKKRKLLADVLDKPPKDTVKNGVTYRTLSINGPANRRTGQLFGSNPPPKMNKTSRQLKEHLLVRKRVQHVWGGRSSFLPN